MIRELSVAQMGHCVRHPPAASEHVSSRGHIQTSHSTGGHEMADEVGRGEATKGLFGAMPAMLLSCCIHLPEIRSQELRVHQMIVYCETCPRLETYSQWVYRKIDGEATISWPPTAICRIPRLELCLLAEAILSAAHHIGVHQIVS